MRLAGRMLMTLRPSLPYLAKTTAMTPFKLTPRARQRFFFASVIKAFAKKVSSRSAKSIPCFTRLARRFGSSQTICTHQYVYTKWSSINRKLEMAKEAHGRGADGSFLAVAPFGRGPISLVAIPSIWLDFCSWQWGRKRLNSRLPDVLAVAGTSVLAFQNAETMEIVPFRTSAWIAGKEEEPSSRWNGGRGRQSN